MGGNKEDILGRQYGKPILADFSRIFDPILADLDRFGPKLLKNGLPGAREGIKKLPECIVINLA